MLSSHQGKMSSTTSQSSPSPFYTGEGYNKMQDEPMDIAMDFAFENLGAPQAAPNRSQGTNQSKSLTRRPSKMMETMNPDISLTASPTQSPCIGVSLVQSGLTDSVHGAGFMAGLTSVTSTKRARKDLLIATDLANGFDSQDHAVAQTTPVNASFIATPSPPFTHHPSPYPSTQSHHHSHSSQRSRHGDGHRDCAQCNTPPANCKIPNLSRRSSLAQVMSPPASAGIVKSATSNAIFSSSEHHHLHDTSKTGNTNMSDSPKNRLQKRRSSILGASKKQFPTSSISINDITNNIPPNMNSSPMRMDASMTGSSSMFNVHNTTDTSYLPTPTESTFRGAISNSSFPSFPPVGSMMPSLPPTPSSAYFPGVHPFDIPSSLDAARSGQSVGSPLSMSTATKSATIQYLQQLQSMMHTDFQQGFNSFSSDPFQQQRQKVPGPQRRTSKAKLKRRASAFALGANINNASLPPSSLSWPSEQEPLLQRQSSLPSTSSQQQHQAPQQSENSSKPYHGPAPCGNPDPLYEYLASPTIVPGLEIIGQDYYGNYVQILPICPETTCSMNQDPVYLNLLQAIYAHTIPFLDLAPGSEEETQRLLNGTPSAIATQSIQPPFKHLLPLTNPLDGQKTSTSRSSNQLCAQGNPRLSTDWSRAYDEHTPSTLTSSISSPSILATPSSSNNKLLRRASMASISSTGPNSRRSSVVASTSSSSTTATSSLTNPARKKKNAPRTHPYKSTSSFSEDNSMVTEAILTQVGGVGSIGNANNGAVTDPRRKVAEKTVHMDEREYAEHYSKHQQSINKSASNSSLCLAQTMATSMVGSSLGAIDPSSLMASSISAPSITNAIVSATSASSALESIAAADFIRALSECNGGMGDLGLSHPSSSDLKAKCDHMTLAEQEELVSLENLMMMDSTTAAAVHAAASATTWPNWFDLNQLEQDVCDSTHRDFEGMPLSTSCTLTSYQGARSNSTTHLLLSSSSNLAMLDDANEASESSSGSLAPPSTDMSTHSTSQILVFDQPQQQKPNDDETMELASSSSPSLTNSLTSSMDSQDDTISQTSSSAPVNDLALPYSSSLLTVLPFSAQHSHPIFPTRGSRRSGWYRSKSVASQALSEITGVDYTTTCWYDVEQLQNVVRDSISFQENLGSKSLEDLTEPATEDASYKE